MSENIKDNTIEVAFKSPFSQLLLLSIAQLLSERIFIIHYSLIIISLMFIVLTVSESLEVVASGRIFCDSSVV